MSNKQVCAFLGDDASPEVMQPTIDIIEDMQLGIDFHYPAVGADAKSTTGSLRDELESAQYELEEEVQKTRLRNQNEIQHLKQTVAKLRDELEAKHAQ